MKTLIRELVKGLKAGKANHKRIVAKAENHALCKRMEAQWNEQNSPYPATAFDFWDTLRIQARTGSGINRLNEIRKGIKKLWGKDYRDELSSVMVQDNDEIVATYRSSTHPIKIEIYFPSLEVAQAHGIVKATCKVEDNPITNKSIVCEL